MADKDLRPQKNETITINPKDHRYYYPQINPQEKNLIQKSIKRCLICIVNTNIFHPHHLRPL